MNEDFVRKEKTPVEPLAFEHIHILIAAYNEESHISKTLETLLGKTSHLSHITIYIGSDGSVDNTDLIVRDFILKNPDKIVLESFNRIGKGNVLNEIIKKYSLNKESNLLVLMDANILIHEKTIEQLSSGFMNKNIGIVGTNVHPIEFHGNTEEKYILKENRIKYLEGKLFGTTIGVFGACFGIRGDVYEMIPSNFITDDLFLSLSAIEKGYEVIVHPEAIVYENISAEIQDEFNRKKRYGAGNYQILMRFKNLWLPSNSSIGFIYCFLFHKVTRWVLPVLLSIIWIMSFILMNLNSLLFVSNIIGNLTVLYLIANYVLFRLGKKLIFPSLFYFIAMNIALIIGFFKYLNGINTNVWTRSKRY